MVLDGTCIAYRKAKYVISAFEVSHQRLSHCMTHNTEAKIIGNLRCVWEIILSLNIVCGRSSLMLQGEKHTFLYILFFRIVSFSINDFPGNTDEILNFVFSHIVHF